MDINLKMRELVDKLNAASNAYYGGQKEIMSDHEWDSMFDELAQLELQSGIVLADSPTNNVSHEDMTGEKEAHEFPALSLQKSKDPIAVKKWIGDKIANISWKMDGLTLVATYDNGKLSKVVTRGDGEKGLNITHLADAITGLPRNIKYNKHIVIRGEAVISYHDFEEINSMCDNAYENPRNLAAGSCNPHTKIDVVKERHVCFVPFTLVYLEDEINSWSERMKFLTENGFKPVEHQTISDMTKFDEIVAEWSDRVSNFEYPVDGLVFTYDDVKFASEGNITGHHDTRGGFALKWEDEAAVTRLIGIEWSVSIQSVNPIAVFESVRLEGTNVSRASLCNISECRRLGIGGAGTELTVIKANKIIPKVISAKTAGEFIIPCSCPVCKAKTVIQKSDTGVEVLVCSNPDCAAKHIGKMTRFVSKFGFDIYGLSKNKLLSLIDMGIIKNQYDIMKLPDRSDDIMSMLSGADGWGETSVTNVLTEIEKSKTIKSDKFLYALCIPMCGRHVAKELTKTYDIDQLLDIDHASLAYLIGDIKASAFEKWINDPVNRKSVTDLMSVCKIESNANSVSGSNIFAGKTFVITGSVSHFASRDDMKIYIESLGGRVSGSVSSKTNYLINNDINSVSSKNKKAKALGVPIISEDDFIKIAKGE